MLAIGVVLDHLICLKPGSIEELDWLARAEKLILRHRLFEIIRGKAI